VYILCDGGIFIALDRQLTTKEHNWNLFVNSLHEMFWGFGMAFHTTYAVIPLFLNELNAPTFIISSIAGIFVIGSAIPQIITAFVGRNTKNLKFSVIASHGLLLPPLFLAGFIFIYTGLTGPSAWMFYFSCYILFTLGVGIVFPFWADFLDTAHIAEKRGQFFGVSFFFNSFAGLFGGIAVKMLLSSSIAFPKNFGYGFITYAVCVIIATLLFMCYRTSTNVRRSDSKTFKDFIGEIRQILKKNKNFKNYIFSRILLTANYPAISLYAVYAKDKMNFEMSEAGIFIVISTTVSALSGYITGKFGDKFGHKNAMVLVFLAYFFALVSALWATSLLHVYIIFVFLGIGMGGWMTSAMSLIYEFAGDGDIKIYFALTDSLTAPFVLLSIILAGICAPRFGIEAVLIGIGIFIVLGIFSLVFLTKDPKDYS
ncbi:uncharacterized protein METZ01_LOCUS213672, partial [marine metagenome]